MRQKARFETRVETETHARLRELADAAGVSMNQLVEGILVWAMSKAYPGKPVVHENGPGYYDSTDAPAVWFGFDGFTHKGEPVGNGQVLFVLDFSPNRPIIEGSEANHG